MKRIVGWGVMSGDKFCEDKVRCDGSSEATCYVSYGSDMIPACKKCADTAKVDGIAQVFKQVFEPTEKQ